MHKIFKIGVFCFVIFVFVQCKTNDDVAQLCTLSGVINNNSNYPGGFKVELISVERPNEASSVVYSKSDGTFRIENILAGKYELKVTKEGYRKVWMIVNDNEPNHLDDYLEIVAGVENYVSILFSPFVSNKEELTEVSVLDLNGQPISTLNIPFDATSFNFVIFNPTGKTTGFSIYASCIAWGTPDEPYAFETAVEYISKIEPSDGDIESGQTIPIKCTVNPDYFLLEPSTRRGGGTITVYSAILGKTEFGVNIE